MSLRSINTLPLWKCLVGWLVFEVLQLYSLSLEYAGQGLYYEKHLGPLLLFYFFYFQVRSCSTGLEFILQTGKL